MRLSAAISLVSAVEVRLPRPVSMFLRNDLRDRRSVTCSLTLGELMDDGLDLSEDVLRVSRLQCCSSKNFWHSKSPRQHGVSVLSSHPDQHEVIVIRLESTAWVVQCEKACEVHSAEATAFVP